MAARAQEMFARAQLAFHQDRLEAARVELAALLRTAGEQAAAWHLLALVERKSGRLPDAAAAFARALALAPDDGQIHLHYANLLAHTGDSAAALAHYRQAAARRGAVAGEALFNRAALLARLGDHDAALADAERVLAAHPRHAAAHALRGASLRAVNRLDEAALAFDAAMALEPRPVALQGRARVALERGEADAAVRFQRCIEAGAGDRDVLLGLANAREAAGDPEGIALLAEATRALPDWVEGHEELARMRAEAGDGDAFADSYVAALAIRGDDVALHHSHWQTLARAGRHDLALAAIDQARSVLAASPALAEAEASIALEARDLDRAGRALAAMGKAPEHALLHARHALASGAPEAAAATLARHVAEHPDDMAGWAYLDVAWRLVGDPRATWLTGQPGLYAHHDLPLDASTITALAATLRVLHRARAQPIGQSLVGGTQTRGRLFDRLEPPLRALRGLVLAAVRDHLAALPPADPAHPLLRHRDAAPTLAGSWSVRLSDSGFHVSHIHTRGVLSSALYIALPASGPAGRSAARPDRQGWLELGRPPDALGLTLAPVAMIEPQPGRLALFPSYLFHGTRPFAAGERLSVAFDVAF